MSRVYCLAVVCGFTLLVFAGPACAQNQKSLKFLKKDAAAWVNDLGNQSSEAQRRTAAFALGKMGSFAADAVPALKRALDKDPSAKVREAAAFALGEIARESIKTATDPQMAPLLGKALKDEAWPVRRSAAFALGCLDTGAAAAQESLETALRDTAPEVRQNAAWALGRVGDSAVPKLREALRDSDPFVKRDAAQSLGLLKPVAVRVALGDLLTLCHDENSEVRRAAVGVLIQIVGPEDAKFAAKHLQEVLGDKDEEIRTNAALALANIGGKEAAPAVGVLVSAMHRGDIELRRQAAAALGNLGPEAHRAVPDLIKTLNEEDKELRTNAALALGKIGEAAAKAVPPLVAMLADVRLGHEPRKAAAVALSGIGAVPAAIEAVPRLMKIIGNADDDGEVRWRTVWAIRPHNVHLRKMEGVYPALSKVLKEPKTENNRMLRYDCAYMLCALQGSEAPADAMDVLAEFLKDNKVQIYQSTDASFQGAGAEKGPGIATIAEIGKGDGRTMALQALNWAGVNRVRQRPDIVQQLRVLAADQGTFVDLRKDCQALLKALGQ